MTVEREYDKKKLIILRAVLIVIGGAVAALALWQYFVYYPNAVKTEYQIVITVVTAAVFAALMGLSAKPFYRLGVGIAENLVALGRGLGARGLLAVALGFVAAGAVVIPVDVVVHGFWDIWAARLLIDILTFIFCAVVLSFAFTKWLNISYENNDKPVKQQCVGYLMSAECFTDESRALLAVDTLINVKVCEGAFKALCLFGGEKGLPAAKLLDSLLSEGRISVVKSGESFADMRGYLDTEKKAAETKRLKLVGLSSGEGDIALDIFVSTASSCTQNN